MSDFLRVTQPLTGSENSIGRMKPEQQPLNPSALNIPDPSKVTKTNDQSVYSDRQPQQNQPNLNSNFDAFLQMLARTPSLSQTVSQLLFSNMATVVSSGIDDNFASEISQFMSMLKMSEEELLQFLTSQSKTSSKFSGPIFDMLREALNNKPSNDLKNAILNFIRTFDNASANGHLINNILSNLKNISERMPSSNRQELMQLADKLLASPQQGSNTNNLNILKLEIFPYLSKYISARKDFGSIRDIISQLTLNFVKYENGSTDNLMTSFKKLFSFSQLSEKLSNIPAGDIEAMLLNSKFSQVDNRLIDTFLSIVSKGLSNTSDSSVKEVFDNILKSILLNKSVYMPVQHIIIPANINGKLMFSEIWIDPDDSPESRDSNDSPTAKLLIKFDIENVGFFDLVIFYQNSNVSMLLFHPESLSNKTENIKQALVKIIEKNDMSCNNIRLEKATLPLEISDVFPKIFEKKDTINVKV